jgi:hypothetical protein
MKSNKAKPAKDQEIRDEGKVRVGTGNREFSKPSTPPAEIADEGKVRIGGSNREFSKL